MAENNVNEEQLQQQLDTQKKELQDLLKKEAKLPPSENTLALQKTEYNPAEDGGLWLSGMLLCFSLLVVWVIAHIVKRGGDSESLLKLFGTILIIVASVFLIVAGYSEKQIAPVIGLLGTIVGYILGKQHTERTPDRTQKVEPAQPTIVKSIGDSATPG